MLRGNGQFAGQLVGGIRLPTRTVTASTAASVNDYTIRCNAATAPITVSLPPAASCMGLCLTVKKIDASTNSVTVDPNGSETIDSALTMGLSSQWQSLEFQSNGTSWDALSIS